MTKKTNQQTKKNYQRKAVPLKIVSVLSFLCVGEFNALLSSRADKVLSSCWLVQKQDLFL